jgi:trimethylamine:corrinoid methyltransferase-like protein
LLRQFIRVPEIGDESLNWTEISSIRAGGHFLDSPHTLKYCRDQLTPKAFLRQGRDDYEAAGRRTAFDQARDIALESIRKAPPEGLLGEDANREIDQLVADADRHILEAAAAETGAVSVV